MIKLSEILQHPISIIGTWIYYWDWTLSEDCLKTNPWIWILILAFNLSYKNPIPIFFPRNLLVKIFGLWSSISLEGVDVDVWLWAFISIYGVLNRSELHIKTNNLLTFTEWSTWSSYIGIQEHQLFSWLYNSVDNITTKLVIKIFIEATEFLWQSATTVISSSTVFVVCFASFFIPFWPTIKRDIFQSDRKKEHLNQSGWWFSTLITC